MAETYSNSLKLTNIGDGDLAGTWGQTTNTNICTLLVQAITGVIGITMTDANYTLSNINGTSDESRNAVIVVSGTNTAIRTVYAPYNSGASKLYTFFNNTTGGYAIQIQAANSGTPTGNYVTIPSGITASVYFDGINFYSGITGSAGNFTVNGTLTSSGVTDLGALSVTGTTTLSGTSTAVTPSTGDNSTKIATTAFVQNNVTSALQAAYPVGSIYMSTVSTIPSTLFGFGTWSAFGAGRVLISQDGTYPAGTQGGSATVTSSGSISGTVGGTSLTEAQMPKHFHQQIGPTFITDYPQSDGGPNGTFFGGTPDDGGHSYGTWSTGGGASSGGTSTGTGNGNSHDHSFSGSFSGSATSVVQPYISVYMWNRTA